MTTELQSETLSLIQETVSRYRTASQVLYQWSCGNISSAQAKALCRALKYKIDFRQPDHGNFMVAFDTVLETEIEIVI
jgi:hypothetical protein